jgi:hypothetical protein
VESSRTARTLLTETANFISMGSIGTS